MNTFMSIQYVRKLLWLGNYAVRVTFADAVLCAICGVLFGIVFGGFGAQARHELTLWGIFSMGGAYAMVGFAIGIVVGVSGELSRLRDLRQRISERANRTAASFSEQRQSAAPETLMAGAVQNPLIVVAGKRQPRITALGG